MIYGEKFNNSIIREHVQFVNEAYFGKTNTLIELENAIGEFRDTYTITKDYTATAPIKKISSLVEKQFGMEIFSFNIIQQKVFNAYTIPIGIRFDIIKNDRLSDLVIADQSKGYRYKANNGLCIMMYIYGGLLENKEITNGEIVAIMLHEIGHNFSQVISNDIKLANEKWYKAYMDSVYTSVLYKLFPKWVEKNYIESNTNAKVKSDEEKKKEASRIKSFFQFVSGRLTDIQITVDTIIYKYKYFPLARLFSYDSSKAGATKKSAGRQDEVIADKFAAIYGYGAEQASVLNKMEIIGYEKDFINYLPFGKLINGVWANATKDFWKADEHPHNIQRINTMISALEFELKKKDLDPRVKKVIENQIKDLNKMKEEMKEIVGDETKATKVYKAYCVVVDEKSPDATTKDIEKAINEKIDELAGKNKK